MNTLLYFAAKPINQFNERSGIFIPITNDFNERYRPVAQYLFQFKGELKSTTAFYESLNVENTIHAIFIKQIFCVFYLRSLKN